ncbi:hypothetical protein ABIF63_005318 [Bradyrhizobium japonicum]|uniref:Uncharacterized protein n=1 Tax=Bradyrhizobium japonicum TaxID=375 RepID=A0ABV2RY34_BRAJP|nr:hypothetical protein [Bradyrhizobium japonicum]WLB23042.1 hypothetical protein QIH95_20200 [Bradyrhizobium japonicum]
MLQATAITAAESKRPTTLSQFFYTHRRVTDLARGPLPSRVVDDLLGTAAGIQKEILATPAANWSEFGAKACLLIN